MKAKKLFAVSVALLFILSGLTSLVYEMLWIRVLSLGVGSTSASMSMVLSVFFLGLSLGSFFAGKYIHKIKKPLKAYGIIEGAIGVYSFLLIYVLLDFHKIINFFIGTDTSATFGLMVKFIMVALFLVVPTTLMGASLPILVKLFHKDNDAHAGRKLSILYGINTLGAAFGAFLSGFAFIPNFGIVSSNHIMAVLNIVILALALILQKKKDTLPEEEAKASVAFKQKVQAAIDNLPLKPILFTCFGCGFASLTAQVVWNKYLGIFFGTNIYGLGLILSIYLFGMAFGSFLLGTFIDKVKDKRKLMANLLGLTLITVFFSSKLLSQLPWITVLVNKATFGYFSPLWLKAVAASLLLVTPTLLFGALLPLAINILSPGGKDSSKQVGRAYSINTVGSILGSYLAGIYLIPELGSSKTITVALALFAVATLGYMIVSLPKGKFKSLAVSVTSVITIAFLVIPQVSFDQVIKAAYFNYKDDVSSLDQMAEALNRESEEFQFVVEGETAIISLSHDKQDGEGYKEILRLKTNGLNESVYYEQALNRLPKYEALLGLLPYLYQDKPQKAFIVGYGGGYTVDLLTGLNIPEVHVVELEKGIIDAAQYVYKGDNPILKRKNLNLEIEDARFTLTTMQEGQYDFVVSQPSHSWLTGVANLFTQEFFEIVKNNLTEKGIFSQWLNLYNMDDTVLKSILKSFYSVFPHGLVFTDKADDELIMLGSRHPLELNTRVVEGLSRSANWKDTLSLVPFNSLSNFLTQYNFSREGIWELVKDAPINKDTNAYAEVLQSKIYYNGVQGATVQEYLSTYFDRNFQKALGSNKKLTYEIKKDILKDLLELQKYDKAYAVVDEIEKEVVKQKDWDFMGDIAYGLERFSSADKYFSKAFQATRNTEILVKRIHNLIATKQFDEAFELTKLRSRDASNTNLACLKDYLSLKKGEKKLTALSRFNSYEVQQLCSTIGTQILRDLAYNNSDFQKSLEYSYAVYESNSMDLENLKILMGSLLALNSFDKLGTFAEYAESVVVSETQRLQELRDFYQQRGYEADSQKLETLLSTLQAKYKEFFANLN